MLNQRLPIKINVAPAKAGAYHVFRLRLTFAITTGDIGPSLRWGDCDSGDTRCRTIHALRQPVNFAFRLFLGAG